MPDLATKSICLTLFGVVTLALLIASLTSRTWFQDSEVIINNGVAIGTFSWTANLKTWCWGGGTINSLSYGAGCWDLTNPDGSINPNADPVIANWLNNSGAAAPDGLRTLRESSLITTIFIGIAIALIAITMAILLFAIFTHEFLYAHFALVTSKFCSLLVSVAALAAVLTYRIGLGVAAQDVVITFASGVTVNLIESDGLTGGFVLVSAAFGTSILALTSNVFMEEEELRASKAATGAAGAAALGQRGVPPVFELPRSPTVANMSQQNKNLPAWAARLMPAPTPAAEAQNSGANSAGKRQARKTIAERQADERRKARERLAADDDEEEGVVEEEDDYEDSDRSPDKRNKRKKSAARSRSKAGRSRYGDDDDEDSDYSEGDDDGDDDRGSRRGKKKHGSRASRSRSNRHNNNGGRRRHHSSDEEEDGEEESVESGVHRYGEEEGESLDDDYEDGRKKRKASRRIHSRKATAARNANNANADDEEAGEGKASAVAPDAVAVSVDVGAGAGAPASPSALDSDESPRKQSRSKKQSGTTAKSKPKLASPAPSSAVGIGGIASNDSDEQTAEASASTAFSPPSSNAYSSVASLSAPGNPRQAPVSVTVANGAAEEDSDDDDRRQRAGRRSVGGRR